MELILSKPHLKREIELQGTASLFLGDSFSVSSPTPLFILILFGKSYVFLILKLLVPLAEAHHGRQVFILVFISLWFPTPVWTLAVFIFINRTALFPRKAYFLLLMKLLELDGPLK